MFLSHEKPWSSLGGRQGGWFVHCCGLVAPPDSTFPFRWLPYLECPSWLRTVGRKKERPQRRERHRTVTRGAKQQSTTGEGGGEGQSCCLGHFRAGLTSSGILHGKRLWPWPCCLSLGVSAPGEGKPLPPYSPALHSARPWAGPSSSPRVQLSP